MAKAPTLSDLVTLSNETAVVNTINTNNDAIVDAFENTLSLDGSTPNAMQADFDMNGFKIINTGAPTEDSHLVTKEYADENYGTGAAANAAAAEASAIAAAASASAASTSAGDAAASAATAVARLTATSTTSHTISVASKTFTTQSGKYFQTGTWVLIISDANPSVNYMHGNVTSYSGTSLTVNVTNIGGSGTLSDWTILVAGTRGAEGPQGTAGAGTGDMLGANNLSDVASAATSRTNLGLGTAAVQASSFFLQTANNLSDVTAATARTNLGLGTAAVKNTGASGDAVPLLNVANTYSAAQKGTPVSLTQAATIAVDLSLGNHFYTTMTGNRTLGQPTNMAAGQSGTIEIIQDGTGSRTLAYHADWLFPSGTDPVLSTTASAVDILCYQVNQAGTKVYANLLKGFA